MGMDPNDPQEFSAIDLNYLIDELETLVGEANRVPFSSKIMLEEQTVMQIVDQMRAAIPSEFRQARRILREQAKIVANAQHEAKTIVENANEHAEYLVSNHGILAEARQRAEQMMNEAVAYRQRTLGEIDRFGLQRLHMVEDALRESRRIMDEAADNAILTIQQAREEVVPPDE
jgi:hypothetical protein